MLGVETSFFPSLCLGAFVVRTIAAKPIISKYRSAKIA